MNQFQEEFYQMMTRLKANSRAASTLPEAEARISEMDSNGVIVSKPVKKVTNIIGEAKAQEEQEKEPIVIDLQQKSKAGSHSVVVDRITKETIQTPEGPAVVTKYYYDKSIPSNSGQVYKCGSHDFETKSIGEFNQHIENHSSKAASSTGGININKVKAITDFISSNGSRY